MGLFAKFQSLQRENERLKARLEEVQAAVRTLTEALEGFPKSESPNSEGECKHGEEWDICDRCRHEWELAVAAWISKRNAATPAEPTPQQIEHHVFTKWGETFAQLAAREKAAKQKGGQ